MPKFLSIELVLELHHDQIRTLGGSSGVRDIGLLNSALAMPQQTFGGELLHSTIYEQGAVTSPSPTVAQLSTNQSPTVAPSSAPPPSPTIPAAYTRLHDLMAAGRWKEADQENYKVMVKVAGREKEGYLDKDAIKNFSCSALGDIDRLWVQASNGRFGFSVQKQIWKDVGGTPGVYNDDIYIKFGDHVGWRRGGKWLGYSDLTFNTNAPKGHLPRGYGSGVEVWWRLFSCRDL